MVYFFPDNEIARSFLSMKFSMIAYVRERNKILVTVTQSVTNVPQTNNTSTSGMNEE